MAFESSAMESVAASLGEEIGGQYEEGSEPELRTVGVLATVTVTDALSGERRTVTHYRFAEGSDFGDCPNYVALGLLTQVASHLGQVRTEGA